MIRVEPALAQNYPCINEHWCACSHEVVNHRDGTMVASCTCDDGECDPIPVRLLRLTLLAPDIIEAILMGEEPSGLSLTTLTKQLPML